MSNSVFGCGGGCGLARMNELVSGKRKAPRLLVGGGPGFAVRAADMLRGMGWDVCSAGTGNDLGTLAARKNPAAVLLPVETAGESGYLVCAKLRLTRPKLKVVLVGEPTERAQRLARFVGAGIATEATAADAVLKLI